MLDYLRVVLLQDAPLLEDSFPNHPIFRTGIFQTAAYRTYAEETKGQFRTVEEPRYDIASIVPHLEAWLRVNQETLNVARNALSSQFAQIDDRIAALESDCGQTKMLVNQISLTLTNLQRSLFPASESASIASNIMHEHSDRSRGAAQISPLTSLPVESSQLVPEYRMDRRAKTVRSLWREYTVGSGGKPAIRELDEQYGRKWVEKDRHWYGLR